jgi:hypothetical protein
MILHHRGTLRREARPEQRMNVGHVCLCPRSIILLANEFRCTVVSEVFLETAKTMFHVKKASISAVSTLSVGNSF